MKFHIYLLALIPFCLQSCSPSEGIFESHLPTGKIQFLMVPIMSEQNPEPKNELPLEFKQGFQTSDSAFIQSLYTMQPSGDLEEATIPNYVGVFTQNGEIVSNFFMNEELSQINTSKGSFEIDTALFAQGRSSFSRLQTVVCVAADKESALKVRETLHANGVFLEILGEDPQKPAWAKFDGKMVISLAQSIASKEELEKKLKVCMGNCKVAEVYTENGVMNCEVYCNGLKKELPSGYRMVSNYQRFKNIEVVSLGTDRSTIAAIIKGAKLANVFVQ